MDNSLIPIEKTLRTLHFRGIVSHNSNYSTLPNSRIIAFEFFAEWVVNVILMQVGMKCFSMRMIFDLFDKLFDPCLIFFNMFRCQHATLCGFWSTYGSLRSCWVLDVLVIKQGTFLDFLGGLSAHLRVSPFLIIGLLVVVRFVGCLCCHPATSESNSFIQLSLKQIVGGGRGDTYTFSYMISSDFINNYFRDTKSWECIVKDDCVTSCLIENQSFPLSKLYIDPIHRILVSFPLLLCTMQHVVWSNQALADLCDLYSWDSRL